LKLAIGDSKKKEPNRSRSRLGRCSDMAGEVRLPILVRRDEVAIVSSRSEMEVLGSTASLRQPLCPRSPGVPVGERSPNGGQSRTGGGFSCLDELRRFRKLVP